MPKRFRQSAELDFQIEALWDRSPSTDSLSEAEAIPLTPRLRQRLSSNPYLALDPGHGRSKKSRARLRQAWGAAGLLLAVLLGGVAVSAHPPTAEKISNLRQDLSEAITSTLQCKPRPLRKLPRPPFKPRLVPNAMVYDRRIRILHYIDFVTHDADFLRRHDLVEDAPLWGPGFPDYEDSISLTDNIIRKYGSPDYFDAVLPYFNTDQIEFRKINPTLFYDALRDLSQYGSIIIDRPHEMRDCRRCEMMDRSNVSMVLCPYANECFEHKEKYQQHALLVHQPHPVDPTLFEFPIFNQSSGQPSMRPRDVLLAGCQEPLLYPLRDRLRWLIDDKKIKGEIYDHPGYPDTFTDELKETWDVREQTMNQQLIDFGKELGSSKICLVTSSRWGYAIQKYGEAAAAGCLIIGNIPSERQDDFREFVVEIKMDHSDRSIIKTINYWLTHEDERLAKTKKAQEYFLRHFSGARYVEDVVHWIKMAQRGQRGLVLPYQWAELPDPLPFDG